MTTIVTRAGKGAPLSWNEVDANFTNLNTDKAEITSPTFLGMPLAPTAVSGTNTTQIATTEFVVSEIGVTRPYSDTNPTMNGIVSHGTSDKVSRQDHTHPVDTSRAASTAETAIGTSYPSTGRFTGGTVASALDLMSSVPACIAACVGGQTFTSGVATKFNSTSEVLDTGGNYDAPNSRFQPTVAGIYQVTVTVAVSAGTSLAVLGAYVRVNGSAPSIVQTFQSIPSGVTTGTVNASGLIPLNGSSDYIEPFVLATGVGTLTAVALPQSFTVVLVRPTS